MFGIGFKFVIAFEQVTIVAEIAADLHRTLGIGLNIVNLTGVVEARNYEVITVKPKPHRNHMRVAIGIGDSYTNDKRFLQYSTGSIGQLHEITSLSNGLSVNDNAFRRVTLIPDYTYKSGRVP